MTHRRQFIQASAGGALLGALGALGTSPAFAQAVEQVKIYYGFPAGSAGDICARRVGDKFGGTSYAKNNGVVETRAGGLRSSWSSTPVSIASLVARSAAARRLQVANVTATLSSLPAEVAESLLLRLL